MYFLPFRNIDWRRLRRPGEPSLVSKRQTRQTTIPPDRLMDTSVFLRFQSMLMMPSVRWLSIGIFCYLHPSTGFFLESGSGSENRFRSDSNTPPDPREIILFPLDNVTLQQKTKRSMPTHFLKFVLFVFQLDFLLSVVVVVVSPEWEAVKVTICYRLSH